MVVEIMDMIFFEFDATDANAFGRVFDVLCHQGTAPDDWLCAPILGHYTGKTPAQTEWWVG